MLYFSFMFIKRNRTPSKYIGHGLYLYFLALSFRNAAKALSFLHIVKRSHVAIWNWIQKYNPKRISSKRKEISGFIVDETAIKAGSEHVWLWVARAKRQGNSRINRVQGKKHGEVFHRFGQKS